MEETTLANALKVGYSVIECVNLDCFSYLVFVLVEVARYLVAQSQFYNVNGRIKRDTFCCIS